MATKNYSTSRYTDRTTKDLKTLRSKKVIQMDKLLGMSSYWGRKDMNRLAEQIHQIDVELFSRELQLKLF